MMPVFPTLSNVMDHHHRGPDTSTFTWINPQNVFFEKQSIRKGKWTTDEKVYATKMIEYFDAGLLQIPLGITLRYYLAEQLGCSPMRITKKFSGSGSLGRRIYLPIDCSSNPSVALEIQRAKTDLGNLRKHFLSRVEKENQERAQKFTESSQAVFQINPYGFAPVAYPSQGFVDPMRNLTVTSLATFASGNPQVSLIALWKRPCAILLPPEIAFSHPLVRYAVDQNPTNASAPPVSSSSTSGTVETEGSRLLIDFIKTIQDKSSVSKEAPK